MFVWEHKTKTISSRGSPPLWSREARLEEAGLRACEAHMTMFPLWFRFCVGLTAFFNGGEVMGLRVCAASRLISPGAAHVEQPASHCAALPWMRTGVRIG